VPSGLTLYWFVNNIISTAMQLYMKKTIKVDMPPLAAAGEAPAIIDVTGEVIKPKEDREKKVRRVMSSSGFDGVCDQNMVAVCCLLSGVTGTARLQVCCIGAYESGVCCKLCC
jgi:hypothetical protein